MRETNEKFIAMRIDSALHERFRVATKKQRVTMTKVLFDAINAFLAQYEGDPMEEQLNRARLARADQAIIRAEREKRQMEEIARMAELQRKALAPRPDKRSYVIEKLGERLKEELINVNLFTPEAKAAWEEGIKEGKTVYSDYNIMDYVTENIPAEQMERFHDFCYDWVSSTPVIVEKLNEDYDKEFA